MARSKLLLETHLKALRLPTFLREYDKVARQCAAEGLDSRRFLLQLCELELLDRERRATERRTTLWIPGKAALTHSPQRDPCATKEVSTFVFAMPADSCSE